MTISLRSRSSPNSTLVAWCAAAFSGVRCGLHAIDLHAERVSDVGHLAAEPAEPDDAQRRAGQVQRDELLPLSGPGPAVFAAGVASDGENEPPGQFDGRGGNEVGAAHHDPQFGGRLHVEGIVLQARGDEKLEVGESLEQGSGERGPLAHRDHDVEAVEPLDDLVGVGEVILKTRHRHLVAQHRPVGHGESHRLVVIEDSHTQARIPTVCLLLSARSSIHIIDRRGTAGSGSVPLPGNNISANSPAASASGLPISTMISDPNVAFCCLSSSAGRRTAAVSGC